MESPEGKLLYQVCFIFFFFHLGPCHVVFHNISNCSEKPYGQEKGGCFLFNCRVVNKMMVTDVLFLPG